MIVVIFDVDPLSEGCGDGRVDLRGEGGEDLGDQVALAPAARGGGDGRGCPRSGAGTEP